MTRTANSVLIKSSEEARDILQNCIPCILAELGRTEFFGSHIPDALQTSGLSCDSLYVLYTFI
jgi:hypothetical protein